MVTLPKPGDKVAGKYVVESLIGRGGMGAVFKAKNVLTGRRVALKWIATLGESAPELEARLLREAQVMGRIEHPNVCAVLDVGQGEGALFLVMEHLEGRSLGSWAEGRELAAAQAIQMLLPAMSGVTAAHHAGVVHRDLKPDNLFVCLDASGAAQTTKVLDFGISKLLDPGGDELGKLTRTGQAIGTPQFMAPEQIRGDSDLDERIDVYALGAILYQLISGRLPYEADNYSGLVVKIATSAAAPILGHQPNLDPKLAAIIHKAIATNREDRFPSVSAFALALEPFAEGTKFIPPQRRLGSPAPAAITSEAPTALATPAAPSAPWSSAATGPLGMIPEVVVTATEHALVPRPSQAPKVAASLALLALVAFAGWRLTATEPVTEPATGAPREPATVAEPDTAIEPATATAAEPDTATVAEAVAVAGTGEEADSVTARLEREVILPSDTNVNSSVPEPPARPRRSRVEEAPTVAQHANEPDAGPRVRSATGRAGVISADEF